MFLVIRKSICFGKVSMREIDVPRATECRLHVFCCFELYGESVPMRTAKVYRVAIPYSLLDKCSWYRCVSIKIDLYDTSVDKHRPVSDLFFLVSTMKKTL